MNDMLEIGVLIPLNFLYICPLWPIHKADGPVETSSRLSRLEWSNTVSSINSPCLWYKKKKKYKVKETGTKWLILQMVFAPSWSYGSANCFAFTWDEIQFIFIMLP